MRETIVAHLAERFEMSRDRICGQFARDGQFREKTWSQLADDVFRLTAALQAWGVRAGDRVLQVSENRYEWIVTDLAILANRAIHVPVHAPLTGPQIQYQINHCDPTVVLLSDAEQAAKLQRFASSDNSERRCVSFEPCDGTLFGGDIDLWPGIEHEFDATVGRRLLEEAADQTQAEDLATILYTSGTTGEPKGVMLSHRNVTSNTTGALDAYGDEEDDQRLGFLPLSHIYARTCDMYTWIFRGSKFALAESRETVIRDCQTIHPTVINGVPYFYDRVCRILIEEGLADTPGSLAGMLGGRIRMCCAGGAALPNHVFDFFARQDVPMLQGYGLTESSPVIAASKMGEVRRGAVGKAIERVEVRLADDGELLSRGPHIMLGYYKNDAATKETIRDGWLYTGDLAEIDEDGFIFITGRKKEIIVTLGGKNVSPVLLESLVTQHEAIAQAVVVGNERKFLTALIVPEQDAIEAFAVEEHLEIDSVEALNDERLLTRFAAIVDCQLKDLSRYEQIGALRLVPNPFTIENGQMTPKMSLRRQTIEAVYGPLIEAMYEGSQPSS